MHASLPITDFTSQAMPLQAVPARETPAVVGGFAAWKWYYSFFRDEVGTLAAFQRQFGSLVVLREHIPLRKKAPHCLIISGAELNRQVLTDLETYQTGGLMIRGPRGSAMNRMRRGLIGSNGEPHREIRRLVGPLFHPRAVEQYFASMVEVTRQQLDTWPVGEIIDVNAKLSRISLLLAVHNLLGGDDLDKATAIAELNARILKQSYSRGVWTCPFNIAGTPYRKMIQNAERLEAMLLDLIDHRQTQQLDSSHLLDRMIAFHRENPTHLTREGVAEQMARLFGASHETISKGVTWSLFLLSQHPRIMEELHDELKTRCAGEPPTLADLEHLPLLDAVTKETLRLLPPVPCAARRIHKEGELAGFPIRPKDYMLLNHFGTHRDAEVFPEPEQFRPERWFGFQPDSFAYLPFSAGPRTCIGKSLGTTAINLVVAMILQRFRLTMAPRSRIDRSYQVIFAPKYGMPMAVERQNGQFEAVPVLGNVHELVDLTRPEATTRERILKMPVPTSVPQRSRYAA